MNAINPSNPVELIDRKSYILGMMTAFAECVTHECKKVALSPPFYPEDYDTVVSEAEQIAKDQGISLWYEENRDIPENKRLNWFVMYKFPEVLAEYKNLRENGYNPAWNFEKFYNLLSYGTVWGENADQVIPKIRESKVQSDTVARILLKAGDWPIAKS